MEIYINLIIYSDNQEDFKKVKNGLTAIYENSSSDLSLYFGDDSKYLNRKLINGCWYIDELNTNSHYITATIMGGSGLEEYGLLSELSHFCTLLYAEFNCDEDAPITKVAFKNGKSHTKRIVLNKIVKEIPSTKLGIARKYFIDKENKDDPTYQLGKVLKGSGKIELIEKYLEEGADVNGIVENTSFLMYAIAFNKKIVVEKLLKSGANPNMEFEHHIPVLEAVGSPQKLKLVLEYGADPNVIIKGRSAVHNSIVVPCPNSLKLLIKYNVKLNVKYERKGVFEHTFDDFQWGTQQHPWAKSTINAKINILKALVKALGEGELIKRKKKLLDAYNDKLNKCGEKYVQSQKEHIDKLHNFLALFRS